MLLGTGIRVSDFRMVCGMVRRRLSTTLVFLISPDPPLGIGLLTSGELIRLHCPAQAWVTARTEVMTGSVRNVLTVLNSELKVRMVRKVIVLPILTAWWETPGVKTRPLTRRQM